MREVGCLATNDDVPKPQWFPITFFNDDQWDSETGASILCSFQLADKFKVSHLKIDLTNPQLAI
jgi:hypothetical protein